MNLANKLIQNYEKNPQKICLIQKNIQISYEDLYYKVSNFKKYLESKNIKKGDKVLVLVPMSIELYVVLIALWSLGAIPAFMDEGFIKNGMRNNEFSDITAVVGITKYIMYSNINLKLKKIKIKINVNIINKLTEKLELKNENLENNYAGILTYTSGTTGKPKIAERTHEFLQNQGKILEDLINYEETDIELSSVPIFTLSNINVGITTVIADADYRSLASSNPIKLINQIMYNKINRIMAAPGILNVIVDYCIKHNLIIADVKKVFTGGGAIFSDYLNKIKLTFPNAEIVTLYGSTEAEPIAILNVNELTQGDMIQTKNGKGILAGNIVGVDECKIIRSTDKNIDDMTAQEFKYLQTKGIGEIVVCGKNVLSVYVGGYGDAENKFAVDGVKYHRTGDLGHIDKDGKLWLRGRKNEPFLNIEASLHMQLVIGKTAVFKQGKKTILVLENKCNYTVEQIQNVINFAKIDEVKYVKSIPVDKRHNAKVDYNKLKEMLNK